MRFFRTRTPIRSLVDEFCAVIARRSHGTPKAAKTDVNRLRAATAFLNVGFVEDVTAKEVACVLSAKESGGASPKTVNGYREILCRFLNYAIRERGVEFRETGKTNPVSLIPRRREQAPRISYLSLEQLDGLLEALSEHPQLRAMAAVMAFAGLRRGEVCWLEKSDVDLEQGIIHVRAKEIDGRFWQPKTARNRSVPISNRLAQELKRWTSPPGTRWLFPSPQGRRYDEDNFSAALRDAQKALGTKCNSLDLRHTFGTQLARKGVSLYKISALMGNSPEVCRRHYAALMPGEMKEEVEFAGTIEAVPEAEIDPREPEPEQKRAGEERPAPRVNAEPTPPDMRLLMQRWARACRTSRASGQ